MSSHFFCLSPLLFPFTLLCRIVFAKPKSLRRGQNHLIFRFLTIVKCQEFIIFSNGCLDLYRIFSGVLWSFYGVLHSFRYHLISQAGDLFSHYAFKVYDSQVYRNMKMKRGRISFTFGPRDVLLSKLASAL